MATSETTRVDNLAPTRNHFVLGVRVVHKKYEDDNAFQMAINNQLPLDLPLSFKSRGRGIIAY